MPPKPQSKDDLKSKIKIETSGTITDFHYNHNGTQLAASDSQGYLFIYERANEGFSQTAAFRGDEAAIWKLAWADPSLGDTIAIGTFNRKVAVFQLRKGQWTQIAYHELHQGSVNHVEWAPSAYGCKLFSAGSEGAVAILELKKNSWVSSHFYAHQCSIGSLAVRPLALNESEDRPSEYPMIATAAKDSSIKIWRHTSEIPESELQNQARIYQQVAATKPHKQMVRGLLWKKRWCENIPLLYELLTCSEDGIVKQTSFVADKEHSTIIVCQHESPVFRISQSLAGNLLTVSLGSQQSLLYGQRESEGGWQFLQQVK